VSRDEKEICLYCRWWKHFSPVEVQDEPEHNVVTCSCTGLIWIVFRTGGFWCDKWEKTMSDNKNIAPWTPIGEAAKAVADKAEFQKRAGLQYPVTDFTLPYRLAMSGEGDQVHAWEDKPHRLIYDLCGEGERLSAMHAALKDAPSWISDCGTDEFGPCGERTSRRSSQADRGYPR
jgi:hypothetical protein